mmetsp:Transcript_18340/g.24517  ORF Transcript_18340/g.24517 Transcript_18340/m.24517 type:complete len:614 (-) Transcript_18340:97-1938(-)
MKLLFLPVAVSVAVLSVASGVNADVDVSAVSESSSDAPNPLRSLRPPSMCGKPLQKCKSHRGKCLQKEECYRMLGGEEFASWVPNTENEIVCKTRTKPGQEKEPCGCCMKRDKDSEDGKEGGKEEENGGETNYPSRLQAIGLAVTSTASDPDGGTPTFRLSLSMDEDEGIADVALLADINGELHTFNNYAGQASKADCSESGHCQVTIQGNMHFSKLDDVFPPVEANPKRQKADPSGPGHDIDSLMPWERDSSVEADPEPTHGRRLGKKDKGKGKGGDAGKADPRDEKPHVEDAVFISQFVKCSIEMLYDDPRSNSEVQRLKESGQLEKLVEVHGFADVSIQCFPTEEQIKAGVEPFTKPELLGRFPLATKWANVIIIDTIKLPEFLLRERKKNMCVQPVRTAYRRCLLRMFGVCWMRSPFYTYSGSGLAFGRPSADSEWAKVDISFTWRPWITIYDSTGKYQSLTTGAEMDDLRAEVNADDCVEVFFVRSFSPSDTYGGGACWGSGTANAKIISSDEQVACGVDITHLAHELGHALGLMHPGSGGNEGSSGTLLCPSGWQRDNPRRNSRDNGNNVVNPLLVNYWGLFTLDSHECNDSASCGSCSAHIPPDSC